MNPWQKFFGIISLSLIATTGSVSSYQHHRRGHRFNCGENVRPLKYVMGDALIDNTECMGPEGVPYPSNEIEELLPRLKMLQDNALHPGSNRQGRNLFAPAVTAAAGLSSAEDVAEVRSSLLASVQKAGELKSFRDTLREEQEQHRQRVKRQASDNSTSSTEKPADDDSPSSSAEASTCTPPTGGTPSRLCKTTFNTTAPMYGVSLTTRKPVTIVQKFPDLLQQVIYETCDTKQCDLVHGECVQTFTPYLFLVIPLGPVTLTGQDYVMVESGCTCRPKYAVEEGPDPMDVIPNFRS